MSNITPVKEYFSSLPEVQRLQALEPYIEGNPEIKKAFSHVKQLQKQMVSSREFHQKKQLAMQETEYKEAMNALLDIPFVEEYLELVELVNARLQEFSELTEDFLSIELNKKV